MSLRFDELDLHPQLRQGLAAVGFTECTPIQAQTLPIALAGKDVTGQAQTGTGKTAAFLLATMNRLLNNPPPAARKANQPRAIVLAPTRELAIQIHKDALAIGKFTEFRLNLVYGGVDYDKQRDDLQEGADILIGTPGRIIDYYKQRVFDLEAIEVMVLDEADRMFDLGFIKDIRYLLHRMPEPNKRLNMLFSATLGQRVHELAYEHMNEPQAVSVNPEQVTADRVTQLLYHVESQHKVSLLVKLLRDHNPARTMLFVNTKRMAEIVSETLQAQDIEARVISGDVPQPKREKLLARFTKGDLPILVATDVAARGLHIPDVSHVINFDLPQNAEDYVHRIGRTARAGAAGDAISFACEQYVYSLMDIENFIGHKIPTEKVDEATLEHIPTVRPRTSSSGERTRRGSTTSASGSRSGTSRSSGSRTRRPTSSSRTAGTPATTRLTTETAADANSAAAAAPRRRSRGARGRQDAAARAAAGSAQTSRGRTPASAALNKAGRQQAAPRRVGALGDSANYTPSGFPKKLLWIVAVAAAVAAGWSML